MAETTPLELENPWLVTAWPGMGAVAHVAGKYLVHKLGARRIADVPADDFFDIASVRVKGGVVELGDPPENVFYGWKNPGDGPDLVLFLGEKQPAGGGYRFCGKVLEMSAKMNVSRVVTFAALGTPIHPRAESRVLAVASRGELLDELKQSQVTILEDGEIGGLNGVFLAAAAEQGHDGVCLLGEFPYFARTVPNPKASSAVLRVFARLAGIELDLKELDEQAEVVERNLVQHIQQLERAAEALAASRQDEGFTIPERHEEQEHTLDPEVEARIEALFEQARQNRDTALELKAELDRQGVFREYEDRFLDLFKQAE